MSDLNRMKELINILNEAGNCLLYTSDAADEEDSVDLGGRHIIQKKKTNRNDHLVHND